MARQLRVEFPGALSTLDVWVAGVPEFSALKNKANSGESGYHWFRSQAAGRKRAAFLCYRWTVEPLSQLSACFGLSHPVSSSNFTRRVKKRTAESKSDRDSISDIKWNLGLKTENPPDPGASPTMVWLLAILNPGTAGWTLS